MSVASTKISDIKIAIKPNHRNLRFLTYAGALFMTISASLPGYINSSFLQKIFGDRGVGIIFAVGSAITILFMLRITEVIRRRGNRAILISLTIASLLSLLLLATVPYSPIIIFAFIIYYIAGFLLRYALDVYLENISEDKNTGLIRGVYLTFYNIAWLASPLLAGFLAGSGHFRIIYGLAGLALIPLWVITARGLKENKNIEYDRISLWQEVKYLWWVRVPAGKNLRRILTIDFLLNFFYSLMVIYMPLYLSEQIGLSWPEIGLVFTIMLVPFVLFELPLGRIADRWLGEKEILIAGLILAGLVTVILPFFTTANWIIWAILLFLTRTGAAAIEIMKETYLFKKIDGVNTSIIAISRVSAPLAYLIGPIFASLVLCFFDFKYIFLFLGLIVLANIKTALALIDTK